MWTPSKRVFCDPEQKKKKFKLITVFNIFFFFFFPIRAKTVLRLSSHSFCRFYRNKRWTPYRLSKAVQGCPVEKKPPSSFHTYVVKTYGIFPARKKRTFASKLHEGCIVLWLYTAPSGRFLRRPDLLRYDARACQRNHPREVRSWRAPSLLLFPNPSWTWTGRSAFVASWCSGVAARPNRP